MENAITFIKKHRFDIIVTLSVFAFLYDVWINKHTFSFTIIALYAMGYAVDSERSQNDAAERKKLKSRGLSIEDLNTIKFVKKWEETRKKGMVRFSLVDGGVFFGFALCGIISILILVIKKDMINYISLAPSNMFNFIGYTYVAGIISGTLLYRILWLYNEQKFRRLTDPLH